MQGKGAKSLRSNVSQNNHTRIDSQGHKYIHITTFMTQIVRSMFTYI